ncbi:MAG: AMP-binding protein, partial [Acidobacteria bacterium]|nr:AMP-binding protein [Acidobacteriota bacterium]
SVKLTRLDLRDLSAGEALDRAREILRAEASRPFDLERGPLLRARLLRLGEEEHWLVLALHHIVADDASLGILSRELGALYTARLRGTGDPLPELPVQYADFSVWQRRWLQGEALEGLLSHWRRALEGAPEEQELPTDRSRPSQPTWRGGLLRRGLSAELAEGLRELGARHGATLFMTALSAFQAQLIRLTGRRDLLLGATVANRHPEAVESLVGFFVNTLALRLRPVAEPSFEALLRASRDVAVEAFRHQDLPFDRLVEELRPQRRRDRSPLVQVIFQMHDAPPAAVHLGDLEVAVEPVESGTVKFDLVLTLEPAGEGLEATWRYAEELFDEATIERWSGHYARLLQSAVERPEASLWRLPMLSPAEEEQLLQHWQPVPRPAEVTQAPPFLHQRFEAWARQTPDSVAAVFRDRRITYGELDRQAEALARRLRRLGAGPEVVVALAAERSLELVAALLGILKAGAAYLPLD